MQNFVFLPVPRFIDFDFTSEFLTLPHQSVISVTHPSLHFAARQLASALHQYAQAECHILENPTAGQIHLILSENTLHHISHDEGYAITISSNAVHVESRTAAGIFYGVCTLRQLIQQTVQLPLGRIEDWPDYRSRGVMLDISRDKVPTMETLLTLVDMLASWKINQLQLYMEHTFAYAGHEVVWANASPLSGTEIEHLDAYCRERFVELVPNQNSLGHMERWLMHPPYSELAEMPEGFEMPPGFWRSPSTLNPLDPRSLNLMSDLYDQLLPHFTSSKINVGCDEPWELGQGHSKTAVQARGGRVYLDYLLRLHELVSSRDHTMQFWGDIIVKYPDLVSELPLDVTALLWGYEASEPSAADCALMAQAGRPFYVCPGTSSWNSLVGRTHNAVENLRTAARNGRQYGAVGYLITDWGDRGHWQPLPVSYLGFAYGAALAWGWEANHALDLPTALDLFAFADKNRVMGSLVYVLGNVYTAFGGGQPNGTLLAYSLDTPATSMTQRLQSLQTLAGSTSVFDATTLHAVINQMNGLTEQLQTTALQTPDSKLIVQEFHQATDLLRHAAQRLLTVLHGEPHAERATALEALIAGQRDTWLARNRPGGLADSLARFDLLRREYGML